MTCIVILTCFGSWYNSKEPNLSCETLSYFYTGDKVKIIDQTDEPYEIDGESYYWYKVESGTYPVGWVYGKYLDIESE